MPPIDNIDSDTAARQCKHPYRGSIYYIRSTRAGATTDPSAPSLLHTWRVALSVCFFVSVISSGLLHMRRVEAAAPVQSGSKITWLGGTWNVTGVNMAWYNWGCDFGCNASGGVVQTRNTLASRLATLQGAGAHVVRWWVFPGDNPWQISVDGTGKPIGINPAVYADFDAALQLAEQYDLYYNFVLFSSATAPTRSWIDNPTHRQALADVLGTLFARYRTNPRVMTWEIFNEPEFQIWDGAISEANTVTTARLIADAVHGNSDALVTIGHAFADGIPMWQSVNLDYYSPHWYDYMSGGGDWCMECNDYNYYRTKYGITKPIVVGEIYLGSDANPAARLNSFYDKGYAGVWGWSLFPERTADNMQVDMAAMRSFTSSHSDVGPRGGSAPAAPAPPSNLRIVSMLLGLGWSLR
jgi:hypothetical protein